MLAPIVENNKKGVAGLYTHNAFLVETPPPAIKAIKLI
jgi:hypothetical protein